MKPCTSGSFGGTLNPHFRWMSSRHKAVNRPLLMTLCEMGVAPCHVWSLMAREFPNRAKIDSSHHESRRKCMAVAIFPRGVMHARVLLRGLEPVAVTA
jgi:hypothetical protein